MADQENNKYASVSNIRGKSDTPQRPLQTPPMKQKIRESVTQLRLGRSDWLAVARSALIVGGIDSVKVDRLAKQLNVTRGGFYWHFKDHDDLLNALLKQWEEETNAMFESATTGNHADGVAEFRALAKAWIEEDEYSPAYDSAVRDWARTSDRATAAVRRVDNHRIDLIQRIFTDLGFTDNEAMVRARITYFHQVGYYTLGLGESLEEREQLLSLYLAALTDGKVT